MTTPANSTDDVLSALAEHRVRGPIRPPADVMARGRLLRRRRRAGVATGSVLAAAAAAGSLLVGPDLLPRPGAEGLPAGTPTTRVAVAVPDETMLETDCVHALGVEPDMPWLSNGSKTPAVRHSMEAEDLEGLAYLLPERPGERATSQGARKVTPSCPRPAGAAGVDVDGRGVVTRVFTLHGPATPSQQKVWNHEHEVEGHPSRQARLADGTPATVRVVSLMAGHPMVQATWTVDGRHWTYQATFRAGPPTGQDVDAVVADVQRIRIVDGRRVDPASLPQGFPRVERWPAFPVTREVRWTARYASDGSPSGIQLDATRLQDEAGTLLGAPELVDAVPGDHLVTVNGRSAIWFPRTGTLSMQVPGGRLVVSLVENDDQGAAFAAARAAAPVPVDDPRVQKALQDGSEGPGSGDLAP